MDPYSKYPLEEGLDLILEVLRILPRNVFDEFKINKINNNKQI